MQCKKTFVKYFFKKTEKTLKTLHDNTIDVNHRLIQSLG